MNTFEMQISELKKKVTDLTDENKKLKELLSAANAAQAQASKDLQNSLSGANPQ